MTNLREQIETFDAIGHGEAMMACVRDLFPVCRSITGEGNRTTLARLGRDLPLMVHEVPSGTRVLDWDVPDEWTLRDAWVKDPQGRIVIDFKINNLHVLNYSIPVHRTLSREELLPHLHSLPDQPDWIPYRTSYYNKTWGFCLADKIKQALPAGTYEVLIDADLKPGHLTYGELVLPGASNEEVLFSTHICHPSLANDNLSGISVASRLAQVLARIDRRYTYRFLFIPGTIGSITWLARNREALHNIRHGLVLSCLGDDHAPTYKMSRHEGAEIDRAVEHVLQHRKQPYEIRRFSPYGYDERQYGSPGFNLPVGLLMRSPYGEYPAYHTSADNLDLVRPEHLADSLHLILHIVEVLEGNRTYINTQPYGEPQLGRRGLYEQLGGANDRHQRQMAMLWVLNQSDDHHDLLAIAGRSGLPFHLLHQAASRLEAVQLVKHKPEEPA